jgi:hypothetical protein
MFNSSVLDIAIGLVLVYLLISVVLTSVSEAIEAILKSRAADLEHALGELFQGNTAMLRSFYEHPLISGLYRGAYRAGPLVAAPVAAAAAAGGEGAAPAAEPGPPGSAAAPALDQGSHGNLPSYIPREAFSAAVMDLLHSQGGQQLQQAVQALSVRHGLNPAATRRALEDWYDGAMDRASGWFKRRTQFRLFFLGLAIAVIGNINSVTIAQYLASNQEAREGLVQMAQPTMDSMPQAHARTAPPKAHGEADNAAGANAAAANGNTVDAAADTNAADAVTTDGNASADAATTNTAAESAQRNAWLRDQHGKLQALGLPIGWSDPVVALMRSGFPSSVPDTVSTGDRWAFRARLTAAWIILIAGYLATAFAVMLGAPFWFDLLSKLMVVRSTVKPKQKSPDEPPVDGPPPNKNPRTDGQRPEG